MNKERDLLPWIFGGLSAAAIAVAFAAVSTHRATPAVAPQVIAAQPPASPSALPVATTAQVTPPAAQPDSAPLSAPPSAPPQPQTAIEPDVQAGQIWECMTKGVKTFSNNPCGEKSTLLDVGPVNTMSPAPVRYARAYAPDPRYAAGYPDQNAAAEDDDYSDQPGDIGGNSYTIVQGVGLVPRRRAENNHRPHYPPTQPAPPSPPAHHNSGPVRRY
jgi:hypothetical protein